MLGVIIAPGLWFANVRVRIPKVRGKRRWGRWVASAFLLHIVLVGSLRWVSPPLTVTMVDAAIRNRAWPQSSWRDLESLGHVPRMAVASEDGAFWIHEGFDWVGVCHAIDVNRRNAARGSSKRIGGSTIPQQVARNVFLWQGRSWVRKGLEAWFTLWLVRLVPRERILELYVNLAQTGPVHFGAEAGAQRAFSRSASALSEREAAQLVSVLPSPSKWTVSDERVKTHASKVQGLAGPWPGEAGYRDLAQSYEKKNPGPLGCAWKQMRRWF